MRHIRTKIYNNKFSVEERALIENIDSLLKPLSLVPIDCPLTILSDEDKTPVKCENPNDFECLGYYVAEDRKIVLLRNKIHDTATEKDVPENILRTVVLIHELGHYYSHCLPLWKTESWKTNLFNGSSSDVLEGWAQMFASWAVMSHRECSDVFHRLLQDQSYVYHVFENYSKWSREDLLHSLDGLRELDHPATVNDWNNLL